MTALLSEQRQAAEYIDKSLNDYRATLMRWVNDQNMYSWFGWKTAVRIPVCDVRVAVLWISDLVAEEVLMLLEGK